MSQSAPSSPFSIEFIVESGPLTGQSVCLSTARPSLILGRGVEADLDFTDQGTMARVGRKHAQLYLRADGAYVHDLHSQNRTMINRVMLQPHRPYHLDAGDTIHLAPPDGPCLRVRGYAAAEPSESAPEPTAAMDVEPSAAPCSATAAAARPAEAGAAPRELVQSILADLGLHVEALYSIMGNSESDARPTIQKIKTRLAELKQTLG